MPRSNNIYLIKSFLSSSDNHLIINQVNGEIGLFYIYIITYTMHTASFTYSQPTTKYLLIKFVFTVTSRLKKCVVI